MGGRKCRGVAQNGSIYGECRANTTASIAGCRTAVIGAKQQLMSAFQMPHERIDPATVDAAWRREKASRSEDVDATRSAQFRVIDPPRTAPQPVSPNRFLLAPAIVLAALLAGLAVSFLMTQLMPTFESAEIHFGFCSQAIADDAMPGLAGIDC